MSTLRHPVCYSHGPTTFLFERHIHNPALGHVYACADDIAAALKDMKCLAFMYKLYKCMTKASGLTLKPLKCIIVPLVCKACDSNVSALGDALGELIPAWGNFCIRGMAKYLGVFLGSEANLINWEGPVAKFVQRTCDIASQQLLAAIAANQYFSKAISVLSFVGQSIPPPKCSNSLS